MIPSIGHADPGDLARGFGSNGIAATDFEVRALVRNSGGLLVAGGCDGDGSVVARFLSDGSPDPNFGVGGRVASDVGDCVFALAIQGDGKIVAAGAAITPRSSQPDLSDYVIARFTARGLPDTTFGTGGSVTTDVVDSDVDDGGMALDGQGRIVVVGGSFEDGPLTVLRYLANGSLDPSFGGGDGIVRNDLNVLQNVGTDVVVQGDGKIVVAVRGFESTAKFMVVRFKPGGLLDPTFGSGGIVTLPIEGWPAAVAVHTNGKIVAAGQTLPAFFVPTDVLVARYRPNGTLDPTFSSDGFVATDVGGDDGANDVLIQPDGKIVAVGMTAGNFSDYLTLRYRVDGTLDPAFGEGGIVTTDVDGRPEDFDVAYAIVRQPNAKLTVGGSAGMVRYLG